MGKLFFMKSLGCRGGMVYDKCYGLHFSLGAGF